MADNFSFRHNVLNLVSLVPLYVFTIVGLVGIRGRPFFMILAIFVGSLTLLHMLTWVDYDQRHRAPLVPFMAILAARGFELAVGFARGLGRRWALRLRGRAEGRAG